MPAITQFLKENKSTVAAAALFGPGYAKDIGESENKMKALVKATSDWLFWTLKILAPLRTFFISGLVVKSFLDIGKAIKSLVRDSGSLAAALDKLRQFQLSAQQFAPFVGGLGAAKLRVAELATLAKRGPFKFEELAESSHTLEVFTRGAFSSARATQIVGQAAIQSGSQITSVAEAVGDFYQKLRNGQPIESAAEQLRSLGVISQHSSDELIRLSQSGATSAEVFSRLTTTLEESTKSFDDVSHSIQVVTTEHEKAAEALKEAFGAPFTTSDVQNTENMTVVFKAITPAVAKLAQGFSLLFNSFQTVGSGALRLITQIPGVQKVMEGLAVAINAVMLAGLAFATVGLASLYPVIARVSISIQSMLIPRLIEMSGSMLRAQQIAGGLGLAMRAIGAISLGVGVVAGLVMITGAIVNVVHSVRETEREAQRAKAAFDSTTKSIRDQIAAATTLAERQEALARSYNLAAEAQANLIQKQKEGRTTAQTLVELFNALGEIGTSTPTKKKEPVQITLAKEAAKAAKDLLKQAPIESAVGLMTPEREQLMASQRERARATQEQEFESRRAEAERGIQRAGELQRPRARGKLIAVQEEQAGTLLGKAEQGRAGEEAKDRLANINAQTSEELKRTQAMQDVKKLQIDALHEKELTGLTDKERVEQAQLKHNFDLRSKHIVDLQAKLGKTTREFEPAKGTSVQLEAQAEAKRHAIEAGLIEERLGKSKNQADKEAYEIQTKLSGGEVIRGRMARDNARLEVQHLVNLAGEAKYNEANHLALEQSGKQLQENNKEQKEIQRNEKDQAALTKARVGAEYQIAQLRGTSAQKQRAELEEQRREALKEQRVEMERHGGPRIEVMAGLKARVDTIKGEEQELNKQFVTTRHIADIDLQRRRAATEGRSQEAIGLKDEEEFINRFQQHRQEGMKDDEARRRATEETAQTIKEMSGTEARGGLPVVASSLARIGGGGNVYAPGGDPNTAILKRIQALNQKATDYLKLLQDAATKGGGID